jgi:precorrin-2 dehydrogenase/sirohydrochlorin ferrochelatase
MRPDLFPLFVDLTGRRCVVVGGGTVGEGKIEGLLHAGAEITVVAPESTPRVRDWSHSGRLTLHRREFTTGDLDSAFLVVAATSAADVNHAVASAARQRGVLCNVVDDPPYCDFYYPAVVRRGALQIAISTGGASPSLAHRLREQLEAQFGPEYGAWLEDLDTRRREILASVHDPQQRRAKLEALASDASFRAFRDRE